MQSVQGLRLRAGRSAVWIPAKKRFIFIIQISRPVLGLTQPVFSGDPGFFFPVLTTQLHLGPGLRMSRAALLVPLFAFTAWTEKTLGFYKAFTNKMISKQGIGHFTTQFHTLSEIRMSAAVYTPIYATEHCKGTTSPLQLNGQPRNFFTYLQLQSQRRVSLLQNCRNCNGVPGEVATAGCAGREDLHSVLYP